MCKALLWALGYGGEQINTGPRFSPPYCPKWVLGRQINASVCHLEHS